MKSTLDLRPMFHRLEERIQAHVQLCWLALLLIRVVEIAASDTWRNVRDELQRMHLVTLATPEGTVAQRSLTTPGQRRILAALGPPRAAPLLRLHARRGLIEGRRTPGAAGWAVDTRLTLPRRPLLPAQAPFSGLPCTHQLRNSGRCTTRYPAKQSD